MRHMKRCRQFDSQKAPGEAAAGPRLTPEVCSNLANSPAEKRQLTAKFLIATPRLETPVTIAKSTPSIFLIATRLQFFTANRAHRHSASISLTPWSSSRGTAYRARVSIGRYRSTDANHPAPHSVPASAPFLISRYNGLLCSL